MAGITPSVDEIKAAPPRGATLAATRPRLWQEIVTQRLERPRSLSLNDS
jgi:hypothetical protein